MGRRLLPLAMLLSVVLTVASCLNNDDNEYVYYDDTAISSFSVGTLNKYVTTKTADGTKDSTYKTTEDCSSYKFYINQTYGPDSVCEIYNNDSLPYGVDASKVLCSIGTKNSGIVLIQSMKSDSLNYFNSTDSIDFTPDTGRVFYVYSNSGRMRRKYRIRVNVHKEVADSFKWNLAGTNQLIADLSGMRGVSCNGRLFVYGTVDGESTVIYSSSDGKTWRAAVPNFNHMLAGDAYQGVVVKGSYMYLCDANTVMRSSDADEWDVVADGASANLPKLLVAATPVRIYGYTQDGRMVESADDGKSWKVSSMDDEQSLLPTSGISSAWRSLRTNADSYQLLLIGQNADTYSIWNKIDEGGNDSENQPWAYYPEDEHNKYALPEVEHLQIAAYDGGFIAVGGKSLAGTDHTAFDNVYRSQDGGITWKADSIFTFPSTMKSAASSSSYALITDNNHFVWFVCGGTGQVWKGRINRLGWKDDDKYFGK